MRTFVLLAACSIALTGVAGLGCAKKSKSNKSSPTSVSDPNFTKPVTANSVLEIGHQTLAGTKTVRKGESTVTDDAALAVFTAELHPKLKQYCAGGCHDVNQRPFASDAASLAYETAKGFMTVDPEDSQMIINIKAGHNGTNPAWAAEFSPAITKVAEAIE